MIWIKIERGKTLLSMEQIAYLESEGPYGDLYVTMSDGRNFKITEKEYYAILKLSKKNEEDRSPDRKEWRKTNYENDF